MRQKKINAWLPTAFFLGILLSSDSFAFAFFPAGWVFQIPKTMFRFPKTELPSKPFLPRLDANHSAGEAYFLEYEAWRRIRSSA